MARNIGNGTMQWTLVGTGLAIGPVFGGFIQSRPRIDAEFTPVAETDEPPPEVPGAVEKGATWRAVAARFETVL